MSISNERFTSVSVSLYEVDIISINANNGAMAISIKEVWPLCLTLLLIRVASV